MSARAKHTPIEHPGVGPANSPHPVAPYWPSPEQAQTNMDETPPRRRRWVIVPGVGGSAAAVAVPEPEGRR